MKNRLTESSSVVQDLVTKTTKRGRPQKDKLVDTNMDSKKETKDETNLENKNSSGKLSLYSSRLKSRKLLLELGLNSKKLTSMEFLASLQNTFSEELILDYLVVNKGDKMQAYVKLNTFYNSSRAQLDLITADNGNRVLLKSVINEENTLRELTQDFVLWDNFAESVLISKRLCESLGKVFYRLLTHQQNNKIIK